MAEQKEVYQKPVVLKVQLIPQENVLAACFEGSGSLVYMSLACQSGVLSACFGAA